MNRYLADVQSFNQARLRRPLDRAAPSFTQLLGAYTRKRDEGAVDYELLRQALDLFGTQVLGRVIHETGCLNLLPDPDRLLASTVDLGCGSAWLSYEVGATSLLLVDRFEALKEIEGPGNRYACDLEDRESLVALDSILYQRGTAFGLMGEILHCLGNPEEVLDSLQTLEAVLVIEQEGDGPDPAISAQLREDFGPNNHLLTQGELFALFRNWRLLSYTRLLQYSISIWKRG